MAFDFKVIPDAYELITSEYIEEIRSMAGLLRHKRTGAKVAVISNDEENKVFSIGFRTPPKDSTGVAHIMEHAVLCGSKKYPAKDPFVELCKGSLYTFLNAMTYPDKTVYPVASYNDQDFKNLMDVYLDAVFYPNIYQHDLTFGQEGWHYEMKSPEDDLTINGVVYNEMKGALSTPEALLQQQVGLSLYPDSIYSVESGGDPDHIPELTYEDFLDFHRTYYHPSNSYIYLFGDMDVTERLEYMDREYLSHFERIEIDSSIQMQKAFDAPVFLEGSYPISEEDDEENASYMTMNWVVNSGIDSCHDVAMQILLYLLLDAPGAPIKRAVMDAGLCEDIYGDFDEGLLQPYFSITLSNMNPADRPVIEALIREKMKELADGGLNRRSIEGALNLYEFRARESEFGRWAKGLMYGLRMMDTWLYDETKPFVLLKYLPVYKELRRRMQEGYFEELIRRDLLENAHASVTLLVPEKGMTARKEAAFAEKMAGIKAALSEEALQAIIDKTKILEAYQSEPTPKEVLEMIPLLSLKDLDRECKKDNLTVTGCGDIPVLLSEDDTNGIGYVRLMFDIDHIEKEDIPYLAVLRSLLEELDMVHFSYEDFSDEVNMYTGGTSASITMYPQIHTGDYKAYFMVGGKALYENIPKMFELLLEPIMFTKFEDKKRIREILTQVKVKKEAGFIDSASSYAATRAISYFDSSAYFSEMIGGLDRYYFLADLVEHFDQNADDIIDRLKQLCTKVFRKEHLTAQWICDKAGIGALETGTLDFAEKLYTQPVSLSPVKVDVGVFVPKDAVRENPKSEALTTNGSVQYNAVAGNLKEMGFEYHGSMQVLTNILNNEYFWTNVRVKGGAYGCSMQVSDMGIGYIASYRDPNLFETYEVYHQAADFVEHLELDERELVKYIIGAIGTIDVPVSITMKADRAVYAYMAGRSPEIRQKRREQLLDTTVEDLRALAPVITAIADSPYRCVIGSESRINKEKEAFDRVGRLLV